MDRDAIAPRAEIETSLRRLWCEVLGLTGVDLRDNFFDLGGHSLLAAQLLARIRQAFDIELEMDDVFAHPTVAELIPIVLDQLLADPRLPALPLPHGGAAPPAPASGALTPERSTLLERRLRAARSEPARVTVPRADRSAPSALSFAQQRLWFLHRLEPDSSAYHIPQAFRLLGPLDPLALRAALADIVTRHETLRTTITVQDGLPVRIVREPGQSELVTVDLAGRPGAERDAGIGQEIERAARRPFDLAAGPMLRATLVRLAAHEHVLLLVLHHIAADGWSLHILNRELALLYSAHLGGGRPPELPALAIQYADYATWQRDALQGERLETQLAYWKRALAGAPPALALLTDRPRPPWLDSPAARWTGAIAPELTRELRTLAQREGVTLFMTLLAAFQTLLHRHSGQDDIVVGSPTAGRLLVETEGLIGFFVNTLVLRTDLQGDPAFDDLLGRVRKTAVAAFGHQDVPFEKLVEELKPERSLNRTPLFQVMFAFQNAPRAPLELSGLSVTPIPVDPTVAKFDLILNVTEEAGGLATVFDYNADLFDAATIDQMGRQFAALLRSAVSEPRERISRLALLPAGERGVLPGGPDGRKAAPAQCVHRLFEAQAQRTPEATAVLFEDRRSTYGELNRRANQLAHRLVRHGVGPEVRVGLCIPRSLEMVVGLLGILKSGGAYVPIDPRHPAARRELLLRDARAPVLVSCERLRDGSVPDGVRFVSLDGDAESLATEAITDPGARVSPRNLAYVLHTSGSTGAPKGVMVEHGSVVSYLGWVNSHLLPDLDERLPAVTSITFDACLKQLFAPLVRGGRVWLLPDGAATEPGRLLAALGQYPRVALNCVPSLWRTMLDEIDAGRAAPPHGLRRLLLGGEAVDQALLDRTRARWPELVIQNLYGPTEATANATMAVLSAGAPITIGRSISDTGVSVLDHALQPVPVGVAGELFIGGAGVARGYLGRPELTAEAFVPDPFSTEPGARLYRTGDRVRYRRDGAIEFLGRVDDQVKLRGLRVEPGEIAAVLERHPAIRHAVVTKVGDGAGQRLVAYLVAASGDRPPLDELRSLARATLPVSLLPAAFVFLDALPLTSSGKIDRRALSAFAPEPARPEELTGPRTPLETVLGTIWSEVLERGAVGIHENFFDAGGHSLLAVRIAVRIADALQIEVPVRWIFDTPTVAGLAHRIGPLFADLRA